VLIKIAPDRAPVLVAAAVVLARARGGAGDSVPNTPRARVGLAAPPALAGGVGGLSGAPLRARATEMVRRVARRAEGDLVVVGVGGVITADDAWDKLAAGASLVPGGVWHAFTLLLLVPFYLFFFLVKYPAMSARLRELVPPRYRRQVDRIARDIGREQVAFLRGRLMCGLIKAVLLWGGMFVLDIEFALPIALVSGLLSLVPFIGFVAGVVPAGVIALTMPGGGTETFLWVLGLFIAGEALEAVVLYPVVLGKETGLHAVTVVVVLLAGGALMGTLGVIVAIPLALCAKVLWRELGLPFYRAWADPPSDDAEGDTRLILPERGRDEGPSPQPASRA
jgi:hypothetical protein